MNFIVKSCVYENDEIIRRIAIQFTNISIIKENQLIKSFHMQESVTIPKTVNIVFIIRPKSTIPFVPLIQSSHFSIQTVNYVLSNTTFIKYKKENKFINVAYSIDGMKETHDLNRKTIDYVDEIKEVFPDVTRKGKLIIAKK